MENNIYKILVTYFTCTKKITVEKTKKSGCREDIKKVSVGETPLDNMVVKSILALALIE